MRLQLTVQRHRLPPVKILYHVGLTRLTSTATGPNLTISQFLEQVNEVVPLESGCWGLEDYAVEVRGFECLHFAELSQVLKDDDEVCIRPLQTSDLKHRKISGRHQISSDGKHLIDGVAFGRPFPRRIDRPAVEIPPRKRSRAIYEAQDDDEVDELSDDHHAVVPAGFYDGDSASAEDNDEEADDDYVANDEQELDLAAELRDIRRDMLAEPETNSSDAPRITHDLDQPTENSRRVTRSQRPNEGLGLQGPAVLELVDENGRPYPGAYDNPLLDFFSQEEPLRVKEGSRRKRRKTNGLVETHQGASNSSDTLSGAFAPRTRRESSASVKNVRFQDSPLVTPPTTILDPDDSEDSEDEDFEPPVDIHDDMDESDKENAEPRVGTLFNDNVSIGSNTSSSDLSGSDSDSESFSPESSSNGSSGTDTSINQLSDASSRLPADPEETSSSNLSSSSSSSESSSSSDSESDEDGGPVSTKESTISPPTTNFENQTSGLSYKVQQGQAAHLGRAQGLTNQKYPGSLIGRAMVSPLYVGIPGSGKEKTGKRNQRRKRNHQYRKSNDLAQYADETSIASTEAKYEDPETAGSDDFEARRKALLESIALGGVEVATAPEEVSINANESPTRISVNETSQKPAGVQMISTRPEVVASPLKNSKTKLGLSRKLSVEEDASKVEKANIKESEPAPVQETAAPDQSADGSSPLVQSSKPRTKIDLASSRRLLFGALGLRTPKTKEDEQALQTKLMKDIRPVKQFSTQTETVPEKVSVEAAPELDDNWRDKIDLRAVECCQEGIKLSTPPFPFFQRWDPQQQRGYTGGKGKKAGRNAKNRKRNLSEHYVQNLEEPGTKHQEKRLKSASPLAANDNEDEPQWVDGTQPFHKQQHQNVPNGQNHEKLYNDVADTAVQHEDDLPSLPDNLPACANLARQSAVPGTVIAFKRLDMSQETDWQPRVSEYKTAIIDAVLNDGTLRMTLAHRDRPNPEIFYDPETGERLYDKFEMPGYDSQEEGNEGDSGQLEILFAELIEPKIVRALNPEHSKGEDLVIDVNEDERAVDSGERIVEMPIDEIPEKHKSLPDKQDVEVPVDETPEKNKKFPDRQEIDETADESWGGIEDTVAENTEMDDTADIAQDTEMEETVDPTEGNESEQVMYPDLSANMETAKPPLADVVSIRNPSPSQADDMTLGTKQPGEQRGRDVNQEVRQEIFNLIREAGWRSSLNPEVENKETAQAEASPLQNGMDEEILVRSSAPSSPRFHGFKSDSHSEMGENSIELPAEIAETVPGLAEVQDSITEPRLPSPRQELILDTDPADEFPASIDQDSALWDTQANQQITSEGMSSQRSTPEARKTKTTSHNGRSRTVKSISPPRPSKSKASPRISSTAPERVGKANGNKPNGKKNGNPKDSASSSDDLPTLETVLARRVASLEPPPSSIPPEIKDEASDLEISVLPHHISSSAPSTQNTQKQHTQKRAPHRSAAPIVDESSLQYISEGGDEGFVFSSQIPAGSQFVDLTLSSEPPSDGAYEGDSSLPTGPGWMQKLRRGERARSRPLGEERRGNGGVAMVGR
ncbi:MAG: hypothetical protein Q9195_006822 [Heterodermia aff. obscurata]